MRSGTRSSSVLLTGYVVLDGFDFGAGALHLFVARTDAERRQVLAAIGPFWDGNEVWLLAAGGALFVGFPRILASGISGFYFAIFLVLWCLILRGISIELRSHVKDTVWRKTWDMGFGVASVLLPVFFGAALGNLIRGVPLNKEGWFELALFTDFTATPPVGILDWYTVLVGVFALAALVAHGGTYLSWKTDGAVQERSRRAARALVRRRGGSLGRRHARDRLGQRGSPRRPAAAPARALPRGARARGPRRRLRLARREAESSRRSSRPARSSPGSRSRRRSASGR